MSETAETAATTENSESPPLVRGFRILLEGINLAFENAEVARAYFKITAIIFCSSLVISGSGIWALWTYAQPAPDASWWVGAGLWVARIVGTLAAALVGPLVSIGLINILFPLFPKGVFMAGMRVIDPERAARLEAKPGMSTPVAAGIATWRLAKFLALTVVFFFVGLIPVVGAVLGPAAQLWLSARTLGWDLLDPYFDCLDIRHAEQREFVDRHKRALMGFAVPVALVFAIPFVGPLLFGFAQAAGAVFVARELPVDPREAQASA